MQDTMDSNRKLITPRHAAVSFGFSEVHLANLRSERKGCPFYKRGRKVLYSAEEFERWATANPVRTLDG